ncbi:MAG TPA: hypothetical protein VGB87_02580, partial [Vicinamibacteria bacterium]
LGLQVYAVSAQVEPGRAVREHRAAEDAARRAQEEEARRLGESIVSLRESLGGRELDPGFRETLKRQLLEVPLEALRDIERDGGRGDLRAAIAGRGAWEGTPDVAEDDLLLLPARVAEPAAVSGVAQTGSVFVPLAPCRIVDTRLAGGPLVPGTPRSFVVGGANPTLFGAQGGNTSGCSVPAGTATAAFVNVVAVSPAGPGNLQAWAYSTPPTAPPLSSIINYSAPNVANGVTVPLCDPAATTCTYDVLVQANNSAVQVVADVLGYFRAAPTSFVVAGSSAGLVSIGTSCTHYSGALVGVNVPASGKVLVEATVQVEINHAQSTFESVNLTVGAGPTSCGAALGDYAYITMNPQPTGYYYPEAGISRIFTVTTPGTYYYYVNGFSNAAGPAKFWSAGITATYHPD